MCQHLLDEIAEGCSFCVHRVPETVQWSCGWCGRTVTYRLVDEEEEAQEEETATLPVGEVAAVPV